LNKFDKANTRTAELMAASGSRRVPMMDQELHARYFADDLDETVELPHLSPSVRMLLVLPRSADMLSPISPRSATLPMSVGGSSSAHSRAAGRERVRVSRANRIAVARSAASDGCTISAGRRSNIASNSSRVEAYRALSGFVISSPR
jgi:hypothetical protein